MGHFLTKCSCGAVIAQCRCPGPKATTIVPNGCGACKITLAYAQPAPPAQPDAAALRAVLDAGEQCCDVLEDATMGTPYDGWQERRVKALEAWYAARAAAGGRDE